MSRCELWSGEEVDDLKRAVVVAIFMGLRTPEAVAEKLRLPVDTVIHALHELNEERPGGRVRYWPVAKEMTTPESMPTSQAALKELADKLTLEWSASRHEQRTEPALK